MSMYLFADKQKLPSLNEAKLVHSITLKVKDAEILRGLKQPSKDGRNRTDCSPTRTTLSISSDASNSWRVSGQDNFVLLLMAVSTG